MKELKFNLFPLFCLSAFLVIAYSITRDTTMAFDTIIQHAVFSLRCDGLTSFFTALTHTGDWQVVTGICVLLLLLPKTRMDYGLPLTCASLSGTLLYQLLKYVFQRPRPDLTLRLVTQGGFSFPSGHSLTILLVYGLLILLIRHRFSKKNKTATQIATVLIGMYIFFIGFSRIYVGVHYPTDVLGGWLISLTILWMIHRAMKK